eukprot:m.180151 g.180151  ORF g.180151 m.180151 type:complete len:638 (+) comp21458_c0_seq6:572-2485(+)
MSCLQNSSRTASRPTVLQICAEEAASCLCCCRQAIMCCSARCSVTSCLACSWALPKGTRRSSSSTRARMHCAAPSTTSAWAACCSSAADSRSGSPAATKVWRLSSCLMQAWRMVCSAGTTTSGWASQRRSTPHSRSTCSLGLTSGITAPPSAPGTGAAAAAAFLAAALAAAPAAPAAPVMNAGGGMTRSGWPSSSTASTASTAAQCCWSPCCWRNSCMRMGKASCPAASVRSVLSPTISECSSPKAGCGSLPGLSAACSALSLLTSCSCSDNGSPSPPPLMLTTMLPRSTPWDSNCLTASSTASARSMLNSVIFSATTASNVACVMRFAMEKVVAERGEGEGRKFFFFPGFFFFATAISVLRNKMKGKSGDVAVDAKLLEVAKYLRVTVQGKSKVLGGKHVDYFPGSRLVDTLLQSKYAGDGDKCVVPADDRAAAVAYCQRMMDEEYFHRARFVDKAYKKDGEDKVKKVLDFGNGNEDALGFADDKNVPFIWILESVTWTRFLIGGAIVAGVVLCVLLPLWPEEMRAGISYVSSAGLVLVGVIIGLIAVRLCAFVLVWVLTGGLYHFWILPTLLDESAPFLQSFTPLYSWESWHELKAKGKKKKTGPVLAPVDLIEQQLKSTSPRAKAKPLDAKKTA